jgi:hypothetical protein
MYCLCTPRREVFCVSDVLSEFFCVHRVERFSAYLTCYPSFFVYTATVGKLRIWRVLRVFFVYTATVGKLRIWPRSPSFFVVHRGSRQTAYMVRSPSFFVSTAVVACYLKVFIKLLNLLTEK